MSSGRDRRPTGVDPDTLVAVGVLRRSHGVKGEASVELLTESVSRLEDLDRVFLVDPHRSEIAASSLVGVRPHKGRALVMLEGMTSPEDVMRYRDWTIEIPEDETRELDDDEYFFHDLVGLRVEDPQGNQIGKVIEVVEGVAQLLLRVEMPDSRRFEVPFVGEICPVVDLDAGRVVVDLPDGLIELNRKGN